MNALDRYIRTVKQFLPGACQDDALLRIEKDLRSKLEEREDQLGRRLNEADREAVLSQYGSPMEVAGRYRRRERRLVIGVELIGADLYPQFSKWLAIPIGITVLLFAAALLAGRRPTFLQFLFPVGIQFAVVTLIFVVLQACQKKFGLLDRWKTPSPPAAELVRRYLHAVRFWLPKGQRDDIVAELGENLRSEIDEREAELGRSLDEPEMVAILKSHGEPVAVASNYLPTRYLIGPALYPIYRFVVKLVVLGILVPVFVLIVGPLVVKTAASPSLAGIQALWNLLMSSVFSLGAITLVFAIIELRARSTPADWDPRKLPPVPATPRPEGLEPMSWYRAAANIAFSALGALIWVYLAQPETGVRFEGVRIGLSPIWRSLFWPILAILLSGAALGAAGLLRPEASRLHAGIRLAAHALSLVVVGLLLKGSSWIEISAPGRQIAGIEDSIKWTDLGLWISLLTVGVIVFVQGIVEARRLLRRTDERLRHLTTF